MRRRRRFLLRLVALGLAVGAFAAPAGQGMDGRQHSTMPNDRSDRVVSPDDRKRHGPTNLSTPRRSAASDDGGFELSVGSLLGIGLAVLAAVVAGYAAHHAFKVDKALGS
jgi:hypothetical protein